jgi:LmeA-like phospholipid-binding
VGEWQENEENATRRLPPLRPDGGAATPRDGGRGSGGAEKARPPKPSGPKPPSIRDPWREQSGDRSGSDPVDRDQPTTVFRPRGTEAPVGAPTEVMRSRPEPAATEAFRAATPSSPRAPQGGPGSPGGGLTGSQAAAPPPRRGRRRAFLIVGVVVLLLLGVVDRVAAYVAPGEIAKQIQKDQQLPNKVDATVGGVPFLTQVLFGKYDNLGLTLHRIAASGICVNRIAVHLKGVHIPVTKLASTPSKIPIDEVTAAVQLNYSDLNALLAKQSLHLHFEPSGNAAKVTAQVDTPIGTEQGGATVRLGATGTDLTITVVGVDVAGINVPVPGVTVPIPVSLAGLPFNLRLTGAKTTSAGVEVAAAADHLTVNAPKGGSSGQPIRAC